MPATTMEAGNRARSSQLALADLTGGEPEVLPTVVQAYWKGESGGCLDARARRSPLLASPAAAAAPRAATAAATASFAASPRVLPLIDKWRGDRKPRCALHERRNECASRCNAEFDLEGLRVQLDEQGLAVATAQEASVRSRKALADRTKGGCKDIGTSTCRRQVDVGCGAVGAGQAPELQALACRRSGLAGKRSTATMVATALAVQRELAKCFPSQSMPHLATLACCRECWCRASGAGSQQFHVALIQPSFLNAAEFRRGAAAEVTREVAPLLKAYQEEVDRVTARCANLLCSAAQLLPSHFFGQLASVLSRLEICTSDRPSAAPKKGTQGSSHFLLFLHIISQLQCKGS